MPRGGRVDRAGEHDADGHELEAGGSHQTPDASAFTEIHLIAARTVERPNYWSRGPVTRLELAVGTFEDISSAERPGVTESLLEVLPGLVDHRCSIGERGGFVKRLRRGTYAPHIVEHIALELQTMIAHDVGFGRSRPGLTPRSYTIAFEHRHPAVGRAAGAHAVRIVQRAFDGTLRGSAAVEEAVHELERAARVPTTRPPHVEVQCAVLGSGVARRSAIGELESRGWRHPEILEVSPLTLLECGLPFSSARVALVVDLDFEDLPEAYRERDRAVRLASVLADGVSRGGLVIVPGDQPELTTAVADAARIPVPFSTVAPRALQGRAAGVRDGRVVLHAPTGEVQLDTLRSRVSHEAQVVAALADHLLRSS